MGSPERVSFEKITPKVSRLSFSEIAKQAEEKRGKCTLPASSSYAVNFKCENPLAEKTRFLSVGVVTLLEPLRVKTGRISVGNRSSGIDYDISFFPYSQKDFLKRGECKGLYKRYGLDPQQVIAVSLEANLVELPTSADEVDVLFPK